MTVRPLRPPLTRSATIWETVTTPHADRMLVPARLLLVLLALGISLGMTVPAQADAYPPQGVRVVAGETSSPRVEPGATVVMRAEGFAPAAVVRVAVDGKPVAPLRADESGQSLVSVQLSDKGEHVIAASGVEPGGRLRVVSASVDVVDVAFAVGVGRAGPSHVALSLSLGFGFVVATAGGAVGLRVLRARPRSH